MFKYKCLNPIAGVGLELFNNKYDKCEDVNDADAILVRSASMHDMELPDTLEAVARAGAGVNNIPLDACADKGIVVFNPEMWWAGSTGFSLNAQMKTSPN